MSTIKFQLSPDSTKDETQLVIGRGKHGVPSSASHVSRQACVLRLVEQTKYEVCHRAKQYSLELAVLGSQSCRVTRKQQHSSSSSDTINTIYLQSLGEIISSKNKELSPSIITLQDGDLIEPYERPLDCTVEEAQQNGAYYPFKVCISTNDNDW